MEMKDKIAMLRAQNHMTYEQIGQIVGVGKSTVRKWENGDIENMRRDKIAKLAEALHTSPAYLMGWTDDPTPIEKPAPTNRDGLSEDEAMWLSVYRRIPQENRKMYRDMLEAALRSQGLIE